MEEFELYTRILAPRFQAVHQNYLIEEKCSTPQKAYVIDTAVDRYLIYRFDMDKENFLPCFNNTHSSKDKKVEYPTPEGLLSFCDYIILAVIGNKLYIVLVEMKSGKNNAATAQLDASETFMEYVKQTALRIKDSNGYEDFDAKNIVVRKLKLKPTPKLRPTTNVAKGDIGLKQNPMSLATNHLPLARICNHFNH